MLRVESFEERETVKVSLVSYTVLSTIATLTPVERSQFHLSLLSVQKCGTHSPLMWGREKSGKQ